MFNMFQNKSVMYYVNMNMQFPCRSWNPCVITYFQKPKLIFFKMELIDRQNKRIFFFPQNKRNFYYFAKKRNSVFFLTAHKKMKLSVRWLSGFDPIRITGPGSRELSGFNNWQITVFDPRNCFQSITVFKLNPDNWSPKFAVIQIHNWFQSVTVFITVFESVTVFKSTIFTWIDMNNWFQTVFKPVSSCFPPENSLNPDRIRTVFKLLSAWKQFEFQPQSG